MCNKAFFAADPFIFSRRLTFIHRIVESFKKNSTLTLEFRVIFFIKIYFICNLAIFIETSP